MSKIKGRVPFIRLHLSATVAVLLYVCFVTSASGQAVKQADPLRRLPKVGINPAAPAEVFPVEAGQRVFLDSDAVIESVAPEMVGLNGVRFSRRGKLSVGSTANVQLLIGFFQAEGEEWAKPPAGQKPAIENAAKISGMPPVDVYFVPLKQNGRQPGPLDIKGTFAMLGVIPAESGRESTAHLSAPVASAVGNAHPTPVGSARVIDPTAMKHYVDTFNAGETEPPVVERQVSGQPSLAGKFLALNPQAWDWMVQNVPMLDCPDETIQEIYYYRWWTYRSHIKHFSRSPYFVLTEFWEREAPISSAVGHHVMEGRWVHDQKICDEYLMYWMRPGGPTTQPADQHNFSSWTIWAAYQRYLVNGDKAFVVGMLDDFVADYQRWDREHLAPNGLYWQRESQDAMEESINGSRLVQYRRPTISSYMYGNALAIASIARLAGKDSLAAEHEAKAASIRKAVQEILWDPDAKFFKLQWPDGYLSSFREEIGFVPWYFELPDKNNGYEIAWAQLLGPQGFSAPYGITTAERRAPGFRTHGSGHSCEWDGAVWPFSTSHTLTALANVLNDYPQNVVTKDDYFAALETYARSQHKDGQPYIGEYLDETTGAWLRNDLERGRHYNHSTYCDLVINGLIGLRPQADSTVVVNPLLPAGKWDWFCLDNVPYHGHALAIIWDRDGTKFGRGSGLTVLADGKVIVHSTNLERIIGTLPD